MKITVAKSAGFCFGVKNAVETAYSHVGDDVCVLGELIHNPIVIERLNQAGIKCVNDPKDVKTAKVIIRSHGAPEEVFNYFKDKGIEIIDATCPFVKKIHQIVSENYKNGKKILILGEADHSEVIGINGWCNNSATIFNNVDSIPTLSPEENYCLVAQTTFPVKKYREIIENIEKHGIKTVEFFNTICYTTKERQDEAIALAKSSSSVIVLGGKKSSNTLKLYDICKQYCTDVYLIEKIADLKSVKINKIDSLAIMAGASTPSELIEEVTNIMSQTENLDKIEQVAEVASEAAEKKESMKDLFETSNSGKFVSYHAGKRLKAKIIRADADGVYCSFGGKKDGFIAKEDATLDGNYNPDDFKTDEEIDVMIIENKSKDNVYISLSKKEIDAIVEGDKKVAEILSGDEFSLVCDKLATNKAGKAVGLIGKLGSYTIFVPASQIRAGFVKNLEEYTKKALRLRVLADKEAAAEGEEVESKRLSKRIVASQRVILEEEKAAREEAFWAEMQVGAVVVGKVKRFTEFGAFVSVKGFDCLARKSELSWTRIEKPEEVLELNEKYEFIILDVDREKGRISLGFKQLQKTPYEIANEQLAVGDVIKGKVVRIAPFGAFVEIIPGVDGLVHISQVTHDYIKTLDDVLKVDDEVEAKIIKIDDKKITLSIKELLPEPEVVAESAEGEESQEEKPARKPRERKAAKATDEASEKKPRKVKKEDDGQPHEWVDQSAATTTLGDLFAGINFDFKDSEDK